MFLYGGSDEEMGYYSRCLETSLRLIRKGNSTHSAHLSCNRTQSRPTSEK